MCDSDIARVLHQASLSNKALAREQIHSATCAGAASYPSCRATADLVPQMRVWSGPFRGTVSSKHTVVLNNR